MNQARDKMKAEGAVRKGDGMDVHHKNGYHNERSNLAVVSKSRNRGHKV